MTSSNLNTARSSNALGPLLRYWREVRAKSQLDLSLEAGVSQRHISFIESGRSRPSRQMVLGLAQALNVPLRECNALLTAAGYAAAYAESGWDAPAMVVVRKALDRILKQQEPYPAVVMDRYWNILMSNDAAPKFFGLFIDLESRKGPQNVLHLMFDPHGMRPYVSNWESVGKALIWRVYRESVGGIIDTTTQNLLKDILAYPDVPSQWRTADAGAAWGQSPVLSIGFVNKKRCFNFFSAVTTLGTPLCITAQEFRIECFFPADSHTEAQFRTKPGGRRMR
jgi:transcriptional regulator with XRE-family HTH domain